MKLLLFALFLSACGSKPSNGGNAFVCHKVSIQAKLGANTPYSVYECKNDSEVLYYNADEQGNVTFLRRNY